MNVTALTRVTALIYELLVVELLLLLTTVPTLAALTLLALDLLRAAAEPPTGVVSSADTRDRKVT